MQDQFKTPIISAAITTISSLIDGTGVREENIGDEDIKDICKNITRQMEKKRSELENDEKKWGTFIKRVLLKYHPDKNFSFEKKATVITK